MKIGELFLQLGIRGGDSAKKALGGVKESLGGISSMSLEAKAAILGVVYGLEHMMSNSAKSGMALQQFANFTGLSTDMLQRWQYMARQSGVSADDMAGSIKAAQMAMDKMNTGQGSPKGLEAISRSLQKTGTGLDINRAVKDTTYLMDKLREYAKTTKDTPQRANDWLSSFGLSEGVIQMLRTSSTDLNKIKPSNLYSAGEIGQLSKVEVAWQNLGDKVNKAFGHLTARRGLGIVNELSQVANKVLKLADSFANLAEKIKLFKVIGQVFEGWGMIFDGIADAVDSIGGGKEEPKEKGKKKGTFIDTINDKIGAGIDSFWGNPTPQNMASTVSPTMKPAAGTAAKHTVVNNNPNIVVHNHGVKDAKDAAHHVKKEVHGAFRQLGTQRQGS